MVDKTDEFTELLVTADSRLLSDQRFSDRCRRAPSPFVLSTAHLFGKIKKMQKIARDSFIGYVGYHRYVDKKSATDDDVMSPSDRNSLDQSFSLFIATCASSIHGIKVPPNASTAAREHHQEIISFLLQCLHDLNRLVRKMQNESHKFASRDPSRLLTSTEGSKHKFEISLIDSKKKEQIKVNPPVKNITDRYTSEIASVSKMKEYDNIALKQREALLQENKALREKFCEDVQEARKIERNVAVISQTIGEFLQILQSQSETVSDMHQAGKEATHQLKQVDENLDLTIKRTESHSKMMITIIGIMTALILLLDYFTP